MKLTKEQLLQITRGTIGIIDNPDGTFTFRRFTERQEAVYAAGGFTSNTRCSSGVRLDFITDSENIKLSFSYGLHSSRRFMSIDLYTDGVMTDSKYNEAYVDIERDSFAAKLEPGSKRVTLYLPFSVELKFYFIELDDGASLTPAGAGKKVLVMGDSITQGYDAHRVSTSHIAIAARELGWDYLNQAIGGYTFVADSLDPGLPFVPDMLYVAYGSNDWSKSASPEAFRSNAAGFFARLDEIYHGIPAAVMLPIWRRDYTAARPTGLFLDNMQALREIAGAYSSNTVIDCFGFVPHVPCFFDDLRLHPNDLGFSFYSRGVINAIQTLM